MTDKVLRLLRDVVRLSDGHVADECPRRENEPFISVWEEAARMTRWRSAFCLPNPESGDLETPIHATPEDVLADLAALRDRLAEPNPDGRGMYGTITDVRRRLENGLSFA